MLALLMAASLATNCVAKTISCNTVVSAGLGPASCTSPVDGTPYDLYAFDAPGNTFVYVDVRPIAASYTNPSVLLVPPDGVAAQTPLVFGPLGVTARYILPQGGRWLIAVGTRDRFAAGSYLVRLSCRANTVAGFINDDCVAEELSCGQTIAWAITRKGCGFGDPGPQRPSMAIRVYGVAGDTLRLEAKSDEIAPAVGVYEYDSLRPLAQAQQSSLTYTVPATGRYWILVTTTEGLAFGTFTLTMNCARSGCRPPIIVSASSTSVPAGGRATLGISANGSEPLEYEFFETFPDLVTFPAPGGSFTTPPLFVPTWFTPRVRNPCGSDAAQQVIVGIGPTRERAARH